MSSLLTLCQPPPSGNCVTVMEKDGEMKFFEITAKLALMDLEKLPDVKVSSNQTQATSHRENIKAAFIPAERTAWQRAFLAWQEQGSFGALEEIVNSKNEVHFLAVSGASVLLSCLRAFNTLSSSLFPHMKLSTEELMDKYAEVADWCASPVRAFAWHPHTTKFAIALQDNSVHVHYSGSPLAPVLKHQLQKNVAHLAWQPLNASVLAVACQSAVLVWHIEPTSLAARPSSSSMQVLPHNAHSPVIRLAWDPSGKLLLSASPTNTTIMAWSVSSESCTPLHHVGGGGVTLLAWSPDGRRVVSATPSPTFRVWETKNWNCDVWSQLSGRCTSACWSSKGEVLLFAMEDNTGLYSIKFSTGSCQSAARPGSGMVGESSGPSTALEVADLSEVTLTLPDGNDSVKVGGFVHLMAWNSTSERLAVLFKGSDGNVSPYVAIFKTSLLPTVQILPSGFVKGQPGEVPHHISFQPTFDKGALLTVVWSSGRVGYIPLYFVLEEKIASFQFQNASGFNGNTSRLLFTGGVQ